MRRRDFWELAQEAEAGSDAQFQFVMFFAAIADADSHVDELAALYDGTLASRVSRSTPTSAGSC